MPVQAAHPLTVSAIDLVVCLDHDMVAEQINGLFRQTAKAELANLFVWFDNERGFASRMLDVTHRWSRAFTERTDT